MPLITRRQTNALLFASALMPGAALAQQKKRKKKRPLKHLPPPEYPALAQKLADRLNDGLGPDCNGRFSVPAFDYAFNGSQTTMRVVVRLDWPPGWRQRPVKVTEADDQTAWAELVRVCVATFNKPWPGCVS